MIFMIKMLPECIPSELPKNKTYFCWQLQISFEMLTKCVIKSAAGAASPMTKMQGRLPVARAEPPSMAPRHFGQAALL